MVGACLREQGGGNEKVKYENRVESVRVLAQEIWGGYN